MLSPKSPPAIRRHDAVSTAKGRLTARRINTPIRIAPVEEHRYRGDQDLVSPAAHRRPAR